MKWILRGLVALGLFGFLLASLLEGMMHERTTLVQWTDEARLAPVGTPERVLAGDLPTISGRGPEGSRFVAERYRSRAVPYESFRRTYLFAKLGSVGLVILGLLAEAVLRMQRIGLGSTPD